MKTICMKWALSTKARDRRILVARPAWGWCDGSMAEGVHLFHTREDARKAREDCCFPQSRVERVRVIVETC